MSEYVPIPREQLDPELVEAMASLEQLLRDTDAEVGVSCQDDSHDETPWQIESFFRVQGRWLGRVAMGFFRPGATWRSPIGEVLSKPRGAPDIFGFVDASNDWHKRQEIPEAPASARYNLRCELCGVTVPARYENLAPILNVLAANGVSFISLAALAARLRGGERR